MSKQEACVTRERAQSFLNLVEHAEYIGLGSHTNPDGDALGSVLGLYAALQAAYPEKVIVPVGADMNPVPRYLRFLPGAEKIVAPDACKKAPDLFIALDVPNTERLNKCEAVLQQAERVVLIDHHESEAVFADVAIICPQAAATAAILLELLQILALPIPPEAAFCLYCGIMTDTGRFQFQNTSGSVFESAKVLFDLGANPSYIAQMIYEQDSFAQLKLRSYVLNRLSTTDDRRIAYSYLTNKDFNELSATKDDLASFVDDVRLLEGIEIAVFFRELAHDNGVRVNLRSKSEVDVSKVAREFEGGGHKAAAGFTIKESLQKAMDITLYALEMALDS